MSTVWKAICHRLAAFRSARAGNVAVIFAITTVPLVAAVGFAVDYSRANSVKASMQDALDATALMLSKNAATLSNDALQSQADAYFKALFNRPEAGNLTINASYASDGGSTLTVNGSAEVKTTFLAVLGYRELGVDSSSTVKWGASRLRVALVLDNTGSMNEDGKIDALKVATKSLLTQLKNSVNKAGDVYVSIIPFVKDVSLNPNAYDSSWDKWLLWDNGTDNSWDGANGTCSVPGSSRRSTCTAQHSCSIAKFKSESSCLAAGATWEQATWTPKSHSSWNGCITDRGGNSGPVSDYDRLVTQPTPSVPESMFLAEQYSACPQAIMGLNDDWAAMNAMVESMNANGNTNQPIGLVWGWQTLVGGGPFTAPAKDANYQYQQIIILLSDGLNTQDRWYTRQGLIDNRMLDSTTGMGTCANIKAAGITIYTIQVDTGGDPKSSLLQSCASNSSGTTDHFFLLTSAGQIVSTFNQIGTTLTKLRLAK